MIKFDRSPSAPNALDQLYSYLLRAGRKSRTVAAAETRQKARIREHQKIWANTPDSEQMTRQQRRRSEILKGRQAMTKAKRMAQDQRVPGGSASVVYPVDAIPFLG